MARVVVDREFRVWEVYASSGPHGYASPGRIVFHCVSDQGLRARAVEVEGSHAEAERQVQALPDGALLALLEEGTPLP